ncbi:hypothetical protein AVEN_100299-1 [Araneus ventricosus]|uniref:HAT C-terminal dimerisation domain-containing protein n=2 Tax=Araneus ventricosus TaxID=182803 RepID=A0A4Y2X6X7_ARAVE|nr:hypothetical protein AVEN_100299-1 [Araneus ventricosus]
MAFALLTCFHEPKVESSFSILNNVITPGSNKLNVSTFNAMQCIKYELCSQTKKNPAVCVFSKHDFLKEKVDPKLVRNVRNSRNVYFDKLKQNKSLREKRIQELNTSKEKALTKEDAKKMSADATKRQRINHKKKLTHSLKRLHEPNFNGGENVNESKRRKVEDKSKSEAVKNFHSEFNSKRIVKL